jgi:hypothetical protein
MSGRSATVTFGLRSLGLVCTGANSGVEASFDFRAAFNATATRMMTAVLRNQQAGAEYA